MLSLDVHFVRFLLGSNCESVACKCRKLRDGLLLAAGLTTNGEKLGTMPTSYHIHDT